MHHIDEQPGELLLRKLARRAAVTDDHGIEYEAATLIKAAHGRSRLVRPPATIRPASMAVNGGSARAIEGAR